jgi:hypothetical protein
VPGGFTAILDSALRDRPTTESGTDVRVPVGSYPRQIVLLQREGHTNVAVGLATNPIVITETGTNVFIAGGPLNSSFTMAPMDYQVSMSYQLTNASGILFRLVQQNEKAPPGIEMKQRDKLVGQGTFEFG